METQARGRIIKLIPIGNSKGLRIPKTILQKYGISDQLWLEETEGGILLRQDGDDKLSWEQTFREMAEEREDFSDLDIALADGLEGDELGS